MTWAGVWSGEGVTGNTFDPSIAGVGDHKISYNIINSDCKASDTTTITVVAVPEIALTVSEFNLLTALR